MSKKWTVFYIEALGENLVSGKTDVSASSIKAAKKKIETNDRMVTWVEKAKPIRHKKIP